MDNLPEYNTITTEAKTSDYCSVVYVIMRALINDVAPINEGQ